MTQDHPVRSRHFDWLLSRWIRWIFFAFRKTKVKHACISNFKQFSSRSMNHSWICTCQYSSWYLLNIYVCLVLNCWWSWIAALKRLPQEWWGEKLCRKFMGRWLNGLFVEGCSIRMGSVNNQKRFQMRMTNIQIVHRAKTAWQPRQAIRPFPKIQRITPSLFRKYGS